MVAVPNPLKLVLRVQSKADRELRAVLKQAAIEAAARIQAAGTGVGAQVRAAQLTLLLNQIRQDEQDLWVKQIMPIIVKFYPLAIDAADKAADFLDMVLRTAVGESLAGPLLDGLKIQSRLGKRLDAVRRARELSPRVYRNSALMSGRVERQIRAHIIGGSVNAKELASSVRRFIDPKTPGGVSYAAMRLARTEINNTFHERSIQNGQDRPWVDAMKWNLSRSHPHPDICNLLAEGHSDGMEAGLYKVDEVPEKPHPQCFCYTTYSLISPSDMVDNIREWLGKGKLIA